MRAVGIICEYNPFHNGHLYHLQKVKQKFPDAIIVLVLNGYFLQRGDISCLSKTSKVKLALDFGVDLILELPVVFGTQSADIFAEKALEILHHVQVTDVVFGSECNNIQILENAARKQFEPSYSEQVKEWMKKGVNYPTALGKSLNPDNTLKDPNDLLGISYMKAILKNNWNMKLHTIQRTNQFHDTSSNSSVISASNVRCKLKNEQDISPYIPYDSSYIIKVNEEKIWSYLKFRILTDSNLSQYMTVDEGIESLLLRHVLKAKNLDEFISLVKTKRYTYNKLHRMMVHILLGFTKKDNETLVLDYLHILGFNKKGQKYLASIRKEIGLPFKNNQSKIYQYEKRAAILYDDITNCSEVKYELQNKPIVK